MVPPVAASAAGVCVVCERPYEGEEMAHCPAYQGPICSLCCSLDARCHDLCKPSASLSAQWLALLRRVLPRAAQPYIDTGLAHYLLLMAGIVPLLALILGVLGVLPPTDGRTLLARICTFLYFAYFIFMPFYTRMEKTKPVPERVTG